MESRYFPTERWPSLWACLWSKRDLFPVSLVTDGWRVRVSLILWPGSGLGKWRAKRISP